MHTERETIGRRIRKYAPGELLAAYINFYWVVTDDIQHSESIHIYPDGGIGLIFNLGEPLLLNRGEYGKGLFFDGANSRCVQLNLSGRINAVGIRFKPGGFNRFFHADLSKFHNSFNNLDSAGYRFPEWCFEIINNCLTDRERITAIETWLACKYSEPDHDVALIQSVLNAIEQNENMELQSYIEKVGVDIRKLQRLFKKQLGMSPGKIKRLVRATCARQLLAENKHITLSEVTYRCKYYDQAHFNREFKNIFGITPTDYRKREIGIVIKSLNRTTVIDPHNESLNSARHYL